MSEAKISFRLICVNPPPDSGSVRFGLQDKKGNLLAGTKQADGSLLYEFELTAKPGKDGAADFSGAYVQGTLGTRFLYLSLGYAGALTPTWIKRIKVPLSSIGWEQVEAAQGRALEASIDGRGAATVKLLGEGWTVR
jgi:hypothetical protein